MALSPREKLLAMVSGVAVFALGNYFAIGPALAKWHDSGDQMLQTKTKIIEAKNVQSREPEWRKEHLELLARLRRSADAGNADLMSRMEGLGGQFAVTFSQRTPSPPVDRQRYIENSAQFTFQSQWPNLVKFLFALTKQNEIYRVTMLRLRAEQKDPNNLAGDMTIVTYYQPAGAAPAVPPAQKPAEKPANAAEDKPANP
jgi:hypothetical protein